MEHNLFQLKDCVWYTSEYELQQITLNTSLFPHNVSVTIILEQFSSEKCGWNSNLF